MKLNLEFHSQQCRGKNKCVHYFLPYDNNMNK